MAYILGEREFWGLPFKVSPAVLVPRPDSETVIEAVLGLMPDRGRAWRILDLGVGSGCLLLTFLREYPQASGVGLDASERGAGGGAAECRGARASRRAPGWSPATGGGRGGRGARRSVRSRGVQSALYRQRSDRAG